MSAVEYRFSELRADVAERKLSGVVVRYGDVARIAGVFNETVEAGAFRFDDVLLNFQHQRHIPLARSGPHLRIEDDGSKLQLIATLANTRAADDALALVESGVLRGLSAEFVVRQDEWTNGGQDRTIKRADLYAVGLVDKPAYPQSTLDIRQLFVDSLKPEPVSILF